jgi:predicted dehydrogenase
MNRPLAIGIIGVGHHGQRYARHLAEGVRGASLAAVSRRDEVQGRRQAARLGCSFHRDWRDLVADPAVEAVCLNVPPGLHGPMSRFVAREGKPLLVEKPLATSTRAARAICDAFSRAGLTLMVAHTLRYSPAIRTLKARVGGIGRLQAVHGAMRQQPLLHAWKRDPHLAGGGCLLQIGVHLFDAIRYLTGEEVSRVWCQARRVKNPVLEDVASAVLTLRPSGALCSVETSKVSGGRTGVVTVVGEGGQLVADFMAGTLTKFTGRASKPLAVRGSSHTIVAVLEDFSRAVRHRRPPPVTGEDGLAAVRIAQACRRSAAEGRPVRLRPQARSR